MFIAWMNSELAGRAQTRDQRLNISWKSFHSRMRRSEQWTSIGRMPLSKMFCHENLAFKSALEDGCHISCPRRRKSCALIFRSNCLPCSINIPNSSLMEMQRVMSPGAVLLLNQNQYARDGARRRHQDSDLDFRSRTL